MPIDVLPLDNTVPAAFAPTAPTASNAAIAIFVTEIFTI
jgi:hypothetical protein